MVTDCQHPNPVETRRVLRNGVTVIALQCPECGHCIRHVSKLGRDLSSLPEFNNRLAKERFEQACREFDDKQKALDAVWWDKYNAYLDSDHWRKVRDRVLRRDPFCQVCFVNPSTQVHHVSYESYKRFGVSFWVECVGICDSCHESIHANE